MADINRKWLKNQTIGTDATLAAGATRNETLDLATSGYDRYDLTIDVAIGTSTGIRIRLLRTTSDTKPLRSISIDSTEKIPWEQVTGSERILQIINDDGANPTGTIAIRADFGKWESV